MTRFFLRHPVTTWMIFTAFLVLGIYALPKLRLEAIPDVNLPTLTVTTQWPGASPQAIHRSITLPVEEASRRVHGVETIESTSRSGESRVEVSFRRGTDIEFARLDLNEQMGALRRDLPLGAGQPQIAIFVPEEFETDEFFTLSLESPLGANELREEAETWIVPRLLAVEGVADVRVQGGARTLLKFVLDRKTLELHDLTADEIFVALESVDDLAGAGVVQEAGTEKLVALREPVDLERLRRTVVARRGGRTFTLAMLGDVVKGYEDPEYMVRANGQNVVQIQIEKRSGANTVGVSGAVRDVLPRIQAGLPFPATFHIDEDEGEDLREKLVDLVRRSLLILAFLFLLLAVSLRQVKLTAIVICSIAFAVLISLSLFYFFHISVNFITLSGLTVCFGMILDNSILVLDAIHRRLSALTRAEAAGLSRRAKLRVAMETIQEGTREVAFPILATTLTTVVAFVSFIFLTGRLALYYVPLAVSVATAMMASLFVAFGWIPVALNQFWAAPLVRRSSDGPRDETEGEALHGFVEEKPDLTTPLSPFERVVGWSLRAAPVLLLVCFAFVAWSFGIVYRTKVDKGGFFQLPDQEELFLYLELPAGTDLFVTSETLAGFEEALLPIPEGARMTAVTFGGNRAFMRVEFEDELLRTEIPTKYRLLLVETADVTGGASIYIRGFAERPYFKGPFAGSGLNSLVKLTGYNSKRLGEIAEGALRRLERNRRVRNARITSGQRFDRAFTDETVLSIDRERLAEYGISVVELAGYVRRLLGVDFPWSLQVDGRRERAQLAFADSDRIQLEEVADTVLPTPGGEKVRLGDLVRVETRPMKGSVIREDQRYTMFLNWEFVGPDRMRRNYIQTVMAEMDLPYGYAAEEATQEFFTEEEEEELLLMAVLAVAFIFMLMAALFESLSLPFLVLLAIPFALSGVFLAFWLTHTTFDSSARIGLVLLFGIVVNNAILLASRFRTEAVLILKGKLGGDPEAEAARFPGMRKTLGGSDLWRLPPAERPALLRRAVARGVRVRLRSILLTSGTTVAGLAPLLIHFGEREGRDIWENLALTSIGGLVSSTVLILIALPATYYLAIRCKWLAQSVLGWVGRSLRRVSGRALPDPTPTSR